MRFLRPLFDTLAVRVFESGLQQHIERSDGLRWLLSDRRQRRLEQSELGGEDGDEWLVVWLVYGGLNAAALGVWLVEMGAERCRARWPRQI